MWLRNSFNAAWRHSSKIGLSLKACGLVVLLCCTGRARAQDLSWLVEQAPVVASVMVKSFEGIQPFGATAEVFATAKGDPAPSTATGTVDYQSGAIRWEAKLADVTSAQLSKNAKAAVRQLNGEQILVLTRSDRGVNYLVLSGARAYLEEPLPGWRVAAKTDLGEETLLGHVCRKERLAVVRTDGTTNQVTCWRATDLKRLPIKLELTESGEVFRIQLKNVTFRPSSKDRFEVPVGLAKYNSIEDLVQSVLVEKFRRRMGLE